jgi:uncharacterized protein YciI
MQAAQSEHSHFVFKLIPPRPTFGLDMSGEERATMGAHVAYWSARMEEGKIILFGPVQGRDGFWGLGVIVADSEVEARALGDADPAVTSGMATYEIEPMLSTVVPSA